jgi:hypothetical protein
LSYEETEQYIDFRLKVAGSTEKIFQPSACAALFYYSGGVPRLINNLGDLALVFAFAADKKVKEGERERLQAFEGVVIAKRNRGLNSAFTVRKISHGFCSAVNSLLNNKSGLFCQVHPNDCFIRHFAMSL